MLMPPAGILRAGSEIIISHASLKKIKTGFSQSRTVLHYFKLIGYILVLVAVYDVCQCLMCVLFGHAKPLQIRYFLLTEENSSH